MTYLLEQILSRSDIRHRDIENSLLFKLLFQITNDILDKFIANKSYLAVVFFKEDDKKSTEALNVLEEIDDDLDEVGIMFVKLDDEVCSRNFLE